MNNGSSTVLERTIVETFKSKDFGNVNVYYSVSGDATQVNAEDLYLLNVSSEDLKSEQFWAYFSEAWDLYLRCYHLYGAVSLYYDDIENGIQFLKDTIEEECEM